MSGTRRLAPLTKEESLRLLGSVAMGRIVFTEGALPAIRPVNHLIDHDDIIIRSHEGAAIVSAVHDAEGTVVAYEADAIDPVDRLGWSVVITGLARLVADPHEIARYQTMLRPWSRGIMDHVIRIRAKMVTGFRLVPDDAPEVPSGHR